jgi:hypothetical protein
MPQQSMPLYVNPDDVIERMQLQGSLAGVQELVESAIVGAQLHVQGCIGSEFGTQARNDLFFCDDDAFSGIKPGGMFRLELTSGFVRQDQPITLNFGSNWMMTDAQTVPSGTYLVDFDKGYVLVDGKLYANKFVQVGYTSGFQASVPTPALPVGETPTVYDPTLVYDLNDVVTYQGNTFICSTPSGVAGTLPTVIVNWTQVVYGPEQIPQDLYEGIISDIPALLNADESTNRAQQAALMYKTLSDHTQILLKKYFRLKGFTNRPVNV